MLKIEISHQTAKNNVQVYNGLKLKKKKKEEKQQSCFNLISWFSRRLQLEHTEVASGSTVE